MTLSRSVLCVLALSLALPAQAAFIRRGVIKAVTNDVAHRVVVVVGDDNVTSSVVATVESDAGAEDVTLVESDAWLHGTASLAALPATDATLTLTLYDVDSASLVAFTGTLGADGTVTLAPDTTDVPDGGTCDTRVGCDETPRGSSTTPVDIEVLGGETFAAARGYDLGLDLAGADTYAVAYARMTITESDEVKTCSRVTGECTTTGSTTTTSAEVGWDEIGSVWDGDLTVAPEGLIELKAKAYDARGKKLEAAKVKLGVPWRDDGEGVGALATDEDPLTSVALHRHLGALQHWHSMTVVSQGWSAGDALPLDAQVSLTNGETLTIPVNSYQRSTLTPIPVSGSFEAILARRTNDKSLGYSEEGIYLEHLETARVGGGGGGVEEGVYVEGLETVRATGPTEVDVPVCTNGYCVTVVATEAGGYELALTAYGDDATALPDSVTPVATMVDADGAELASETLSVEFDDEVTAVFANEIEFSADPTGLGVSGKVSLLGEPSKKGKQSTLAKGKFYGSFSRDADGDLELTGADKDTVESRGDVVVGGAAVSLTDREGTAATPPAVQYHNGSGTKLPSSQVSAKPALL